MVFVQISFPLKKIVRTKGSEDLKTRTNPHEANWPFQKKDKTEFASFRRGVQIGLLLDKEDQNRLKGQIWHSQMELPNLPP